MSIIFSNKKRNIKNFTFTSGIVGSSVAVIMSVTAGTTAAIQSAALAGASGTFGAAAILSGMVTILGNGNRCNCTCSSCGIINLWIS